MTTTETPRAWIGCLASYNAGRLIGEWVDATDVDEMNEAQERVAKIAVEAAKKAGDYPLYFGDPEEFFIADYDGFPQAAVSELGEYSSYERVAAVGRAIEEHGKPFCAWLETQDSIDTDEDLGERFLEEYRGEWDSANAYAMEVAMDVGIANVPATLFVEGRYGKSERINVIDELSSYIDWDAVARTIFDHGNCSYVDGYVFEDVHQ